MKEKPVYARLLSGRNRMGRQEKEHILDEVLGSVAPRPSRRWWFVALPALAAAAALILFVIPSKETPRDELASRGATRAVAALAVTCPGGCGAGEKILFDVSGTTGYRYFAAFSRHMDGTVLWYFPATDDGVSLDIASHTRDAVLDRGIVIGTEHAPGTYRVFGVFSMVPLTRVQIRGAFDETSPSAGPGTSVIEKELVVR